MKIAEVQPGNVSLRTMPEVSARTITSGTNVGDVISGIGDTVQQGAEMLSRAMMLAEHTRATNILSSKIADIQERASSDTSLSSGPKYHAEIDAAVRESSAGISIPSAKQGFMDAALQDAQVAKIKVNQDFMKRQIDQGKADIVVREDALKDQYINASSAADQANSIVNHDKLLNDAVAAGYISREEAAKAKITRVEAWTTARVEKDMLYSPQGVKDQLEAGAGGIYADISEPQRTKLIEAADRRMTVMERLKTQQETTDKVNTRMTVITDIANGSTDIPADKIREISIKDPLLGEALQKVVDAQGNYFPEQGDNEAFQGVVKNIYAASSKEEISKFLTSTLANKGAEISRDRLAIIVNAAQAQAKTLPTSSTKKGNSGDGVPDPKQNEIAAGIRSLGDWAAKSNMKVGNIFTDFLRAINQGTPVKQAHDEAVRSAVIQNNPVAIRYNVGDTITLPNGSLFEVTGLTTTGAPKGKVISGKRTVNTTAK